MNDSINIDNITKLRAKRSKSKKIEIFNSVYEQLILSSFFFLFRIPFCLFFFTHLMRISRKENLFSGGKKWNKKKKKLESNKYLLRNNNKSCIKFVKMYDFCTFMVLFFVSVVFGLVEWNWVEVNIEINYNFVENLFKFNHINSNAACVHRIHERAFNYC